MTFSPWKALMLAPAARCGMWTQRLSPTLHCICFAGCKRLRVLDVVACGCSPFALRFQPDLLAAVVEGLPLLQELTLFGE